MRHRRRSFLANPFWRDGLLGGVLVGLGVVLGDASVGRREGEGWGVLALAVVLVVAGGGILGAAGVHAVWRGLRGARRPPGGG